MLEPVVAFAKSLFPSSKDEHATELLRNITSSDTIQLLVDSNENKKKINAIHAHIERELKKESNESHLSKERVKVYKEIQNLL